MLRARAWQRQLEHVAALGLTQALTMRAQPWLMHLWESHKWLVVWQGRQGRRAGVHWQPLVVLWGLALCAGGNEDVRVGMAAGVVAITLCVCT